MAEIAEKGERGWQDALRPVAAELSWGEHPIRPFHYEIELPEVFDRENPGFDAIVGNPPFLGGTLITSALSVPYLAWLKDAFPKGGDRADLIDLIAYFFRRAFYLIRSGGSFGLLATNTISQGDTRHAGLQWVCKHNGVIYRARRWYKWPGEAAVRVNVIHIAKDISPVGVALDDREVQHDQCILGSWLRA